MQITNERKLDQIREALLETLGASPEDLEEARNRQPRGAARKAARRPRRVSPHSAGTAS